MLFVWLLLRFCFRRRNLDLLIISHLFMRIENPHKKQTWKTVGAKVYLGKRMARHTPENVINLMWIVDVVSILYDLQRLSNHFLTLRLLIILVCIGSDVGDTWIDGSERLRVLAPWIATFCNIARNTRLILLGLGYRFLEFRRIDCLLWVKVLINALFNRVLFVMAWTKQSIALGIDDKIGHYYYL